MDITTKVIDLAELTERDDFPAFAAIYSAKSANPFLFSPTAMHCGNSIYLSRLDDCKLFLSSQKKKTALQADRTV
jgi:hypothetical protein